MSYTITEESFASLTSYWNDPLYNLRRNSLFVLPIWLQVWWQAFGSGAELYLRAVWEGDKIIGIAPLMVRDKTAHIIGDTDVCDYLDFIIAPGMESDFYPALLDDLRQNGIERLDLSGVRPDSTVLINLVPIAQSRNYDILINAEDISLELELPSTWDEYLTLLTAKQRHEVRRKLRRLSEEGNVDYRIVEDSTAVDNTMNTFLRQFSESREDKANFMTARMASFFRSLADAMAKAGLLSIGILELDTLPVAMVICLDYNGCVYLYNSSYAPQYRSLSVGVLSKVLHIKDSIQRGRKKFDFLKGSESYKYHLGGKETPLYSCQITIN